MLSDAAPISPEHEEVDSDYVESQSGDFGLDQLHIAMTDLQHVDDVIGESVETASQLIEEEEAVQQVQAQDEGASQAALESLQRNVNSLLKRVGMEKRADFANGAYTSKRFNKVALESAIDSIRDFIKRIWEAIKAAIDKTIEMVKTILKHFFDVTLKIKNQCAGIKAQAEAKKGRTHPSRTKLGSDSLSRYVRFGNKPLEPSDVLLNFNRWTAHNYNFVDSISGKAAIDEYTGYVRKAAVYMTDRALKDAKEGLLNRELDSLGGLMISRIVSNFEIHKGDIHKTKPYIGDSYYKFDETNLGFSIQQIEDYKAIPIVDSHTPLSAAQAIELSDKITAHMSEYENIQKHFDELGKLKSTVSALAAEAIKDTAGLDVVQRKAVSEGTAFIIRLFINAIGKVGIGVREYDLHMCRALCTWCSLSMSSL